MTKITPACCMDTTLATDTYITTAKVDWSPHTFIDRDTRLDCRSNNMYRTARLTRPPSNTREHNQRNIYARNSLQKRRLFHQRGSSGKKLQCFIVFCFISMVGWYRYTGNVSKVSEEQVGHSSGIDAGGLDFNASLPTNKDVIRVPAGLRPDSMKDSKPSNTIKVTGNSGGPDNKDQQIAVTKDTEDASETITGKDTSPDDAEEETLGEVHDIHDHIPASMEHKEEAYDEFKCSFREYKPHRYYPIDDLSEKFLSESEYIRGQLPFVINPRGMGADNEMKDTDASSNSAMPKKICTDTSEWEDVKPDHRPFSDGQNPSFVSLAADAYNAKSEIPRIDRNSIDPLVQIYGADSIDNYYVGLLLFGDSQCRWNMTADELESKKFSPLQKPPEKRSMVMVLNENLNPIGRAVLELEHDFLWGDKRKKYEMKKKIEDGKEVGYETSVVELDDARLFFHGGKLHVLYRNGPSFGYEKQIQNPIHFERVGEDKFRAVIKASESFSVCCGRNIAFISEIPEADSIPSEISKSSKGHLMALTWIDPVTTEMVDYTVDGSDAADTKRRLLERNGYGDERRRLREKKKKKSSIHGTNGYLVPLHTSSELLGIAHFHRPENRDTSDYARHGHHYTHAFFTLEQKIVSREDGDGDTTKFGLKRLSNEFVFTAPSSLNDHTADVIQFASGIDLVGGDEDGKLMISYGINDCEAAIVFLEMAKVQEFLLPVDNGEEVVNLMKKLT